MISHLPSSYFKLLLLIPLALTLSGCGVVIIGGAAAGTVGYMSGDLKTTLEKPYDQVVAATNHAITENSISVISKTEEKSKVSYVFKTLQGDKVQLNLEYATKELTHVSIRVGLIGDEPLSRQILNEIESRLNN